MLAKRFIARVLVAVGIVVFVTVAMALASTGEGDPPVSGPSPRAEAMDGSFSNAAQSGEAVFRAAGLELGDTTDGTVLVTNEGSSQGMFWLARTGFSDRQGPAGGTLSERLQVTVLDVTVPDAPMLVYTGGLTQMGARPLGFVAPGKSRIYSMAATLLPDSVPPISAGSDPYEGSSTTISLRWGAIAGRPPASSDSAVLETPKADERGPRLRLDVPSRQRLLETGGLTVNARCNEPCRLEATGRLRPEGAASSTARVRRRAQRGEPAALRIVFGPAARQALRDALTAGQSVPVGFTVEARDEAGNKAGASRNITLRPSR